MSINIPGSGIWVPGQQLLDNGDFIHPVNQRMQTVCTGGFFIDRWFVSHGRATLTPDGIALEKTDVDCFMCETIEAERISKDNPVVTASIKVPSMSNGALYKIRFIVWDKSGGALDINGELATSPGVIFFTVDLSPYKNFEMLEVRLMNSSDDLGKSVTFSAAKLELGPISTIAYDAPPDPATELLKCQRYYEVITSETLQTAGYHPKTLYGIDNNKCLVMQPWKATKRTIPTVIVNGATEGQHVIFRCTQDNSLAEGSLVSWNESYLGGRMSIEISDIVYEFQPGKIYEATIIGDAEIY